VISTVESLFFASYCLASLAAAFANADAFPLAKSSDLGFKVYTVLKLFELHHPTETLTHVMRACLEAPEHKRVRGLRNVLTHRGPLPRQVTLALKAEDDRPDAIPSNPGDIATQWNYGAFLDEHMTGDAMEWLTHDLAALIGAARSFCFARLSEDAAPPAESA